MFTSRKHLFWSADVESLDSQKHKQYIVHQVLQYGDIADFTWLRQLYSPEEIKSVFLTHPRKTYSARTFNFIKHFLLHIDTQLDEGKYVTAFS